MDEWVDGWVDGGWVIRVSSGCGCITYGCGGNDHGMGICTVTVNTKQLSWRGEAVPAGWLLKGPCVPCSEITSEHCCPWSH